jgi:hypothetical protein
MARRNPAKKRAPAADPTAKPTPRHSWIAIAFSTMALGGIGCLDYVAAGGESLLFFYLVPVALTTWLAGRKAGIVFSALSAGVILMVRLWGSLPLWVVTWNAGIGLAICLTVSSLLHRLKGHGADHRALLGWLPRICLSAPFCALLLGGTAVLAYRGITSGASLSGAEASALLAKMATDVRKCMDVCRPVLLGSRDPAGHSCIDVVRTGDVTDLSKVPSTRGDLDGGPGTKIGLVCVGLGMTRNTPDEDFAWHQGRLKALLENMAVSNGEPRRLSEELAKEAIDFSRRLGACTGFPTRFSAAKFSDKGDWPSLCLTSLNEAVAARDLPAAQRWAAEFASAMLSLADLHRWLEFLVANHLTALEFQARCAPLFAWATPRMPRYVQESDMSCFPAGMLTLHGRGNYLEVERQAEQLFQTPKDRLAEVADRKCVTEASVWMPPCLREVFLKLEEKLSPANRRTWEEAARTPFEHAYLVNMLFRATRGDMVDQLAVVLQRLNEIKPNATLAELMGAMMYRGHSFGGLEWADRYQPLLMQAAADLHGSDEQAFLGAHRHTYGFFRTATYAVAVTLREAIDKRRLDCVRATDMMGDIYQNSGRARMGHVRMSVGTFAHSVAAVTTADGGQSKTLLLDGMAPMERPEIWPDAYFRGHAWPAGFQNYPSPYCVELYARGLDNYIWAEGYIIRDVNAGTLTKAAVPYLPGHEKTTTEKVPNEAASQVATVP